MAYYFFELLQIIVDSPRSTAHLLELQNLFSFGTGDKATNQKMLVLMYSLSPWGGKFD